MKKQDIFIGNCSKYGIYNYKFFKGKLSFNYKTNDYERCTYITKSKNNLYGVLEVKDELNNNNGYVVSYKIKKDKLININKVISCGQGPCHISVNTKKKIVLVSNYIDGHFSAFKINKDGSIGKNIYNNVLNKEKSHMHFAQMKNDDFFLYAVDLGLDVIVVYEVGNTIKEVDRLNLGLKVEPRHLVIDNDFVYVITENTCKLYTLKLENKKLKVISIQSILPENVDIKSNYTGCAIKLSKNRKNLYVSIRGHNSISVFKKIDKTFQIVQNISCNGDLPRDIELDKKDKYLLVANQDSGDIAVFKRNNNTGKLKYFNNEKMESPTCIIAK